MAFIPIQSIAILLVKRRMVVASSILSSDISVVVQGAIDAKLTPKCLRSIRKHLPEAEIILSTWKNSATNTLDYDKLVLNDDPGGVICDVVNGVMNNVNRQIESSKNGLRAATRRFALKIRSDMIVKRTTFLKYWGKFDHDRVDDCKIFENRIIINNLYCANPDKTSFLFHISDWVQFGLRTDVLKLWDIDLVSRYELGEYWVGKERPPIDVFSNWLGRYIPEQYIWSQCLKKNAIKFDFEYYTDISPNSKAISELSFANNTVILDYEDYGIRFVKYNPYKWNAKSQYNHAIWLHLFKKYCAPSYNIAFKRRWQYLCQYSPIISEDVERIKRHSYLFCHLGYHVLKRIFRWGRRPFLVVWYAVWILRHMTRVVINREK